MICPKCRTERFLILREEVDKEYIYRSFRCVECGFLWNAKRSRSSEFVLW